MVSNFLSNSDNLVLSSTTKDKIDRQQFLKFHLEPDTKIMFPINQLTEVLKIPIGKIIPIPHMHPWVMGVYNWRGEILWMVDLGHLVGLTPWHQIAKSFSYYNAIVLSSSGEESKKSERKSIGLIVDRVEDIEMCDPSSIQSPPASAVTPELAPFLHGYWVKPNGEVLLSLSGDAILSGTSKLMR